MISKAVIEEFARRYLVNPAVLWISESGAKVVARDDELAGQLKRKISADRNLPDIILVDLGDGKNGGIVLVFVEVVATDGPVTAPRQEALLKIATEAGFPAHQADSGLTASCPGAGPGALLESASWWMRTGRRLAAASTSNCSMMSAANGTRNACAEAEVTFADKETVIAITVVMVGPPSLWTMFTAIVARLNFSPGTAAYAAAIEGMPVAPCPMPRTKRPMSAGAFEKPPKAKRNGRVPRKFRSTPPEATARQPNLSVKYPMHGYTHSMPTPMDPRIQPVCVAVRLQPVTKKSGMRN